MPITNSSSVSDWMYLEIDFPAGIPSRATDNACPRGSSSAYSARGVPSTQTVISRPRRSGITAIVWIRYSIKRKINTERDSAEQVEGQQHDFLTV
jgi:hypothetical protein